MVYCYLDDLGYEVCESSSWHDWGRWVLCGVLVGVFVLTVVSFLLFACISSRQRVKAGEKPYRMTQWAAPPAYSREDPHPEAKDFAAESSSGAPSYGEAVNGANGRVNGYGVSGGAGGYYGASAGAGAGAEGERVQDGMNTLANERGDHLAVPGAVADPSRDRETV